MLSISFTKKQQDFFLPFLFFTFLTDIFFYNIPLSDIPKYPSYVFSITPLNSSQSASAYPCLSTKNPLPELFKNRIGIVFALCQQLYKSTLKAKVNGYEFKRLLPPPKGNGFPPTTTKRIFFMKLDHFEFHFRKVKLSLYS